MIKKTAIIIILFALVFTTFQYLYFSKVTEIDWYSAFSEGTITLTVFILLINLQSIRNNKNIFIYLNLGFSLLFIAFLTDTLDEIFNHPKLLTTVLEDFFQVLGFIIVLAGLREWVKLNYKQNEELKILSTTDELTGLFIRRYFQERVFEEFNRSNRTKSNFSILMIDIDHFKTINDDYGHFAGDRVLQKFSGTIKSCIRKTDTLARWGGDEFIILLVDIKIDIYSKVAEKIRQECERLSVISGDDAINFTVSIGATISRDGDESVNEIIERADQLLYDAKNNGRNCIALEFLK